MVVLILCTSTIYYDWNVYMDLFFHVIKYGRLAANFFSHDYNHNSNKAQVIMLILSTSTIYYDSNVYMDLLGHVIKNGRLAAILFFYHIFSHNVDMG